MITPNANFRANPSRAIHVSSVIDYDLVTRLAPEILRLQHTSREPITVYVASPGGNPSAMESLLRVLRLSDQDSAASCRLITAVTTHAASAAADLLSSGDYVLAYSDSWLLYHGTRDKAAEPLTFETTSRMGQTLRQSNAYYAMELARKVEHRFAFRFMWARSEFNDLRLELAKPGLSDLDCFLHHISQHLSAPASAVWGRARERHLRYKGLFDTVLRKAGDGVGAHPTKLEAKRIKAIVDFEVNSNRNQPGWGFLNGGIEKLADDFFLLNEYLSAAGDARLRGWVGRFGRLFVTPEDRAEIEALADSEAQAARVVEIVLPILEPLWSFFVALCHALQTGENYLTAYDAYWLGLVDEVVGSDLMSYRTLVEFEPDPPAEPRVLAGDRP